MRQRILLQNRGRKPFYWSRYGRIPLLWCVNRPVSLYLCMFYFSIVITSTNTHISYLMPLCDWLQFPLPHTRGSSHGASRIIRTTYPEPFVAKMMPTAFEMWRALEEESGMELFKSAAFSF